MKVKRLDSGRPDAKLYEVSSGMAWWTACVGDDGGVSIFNSQLRALKPDGPTGRQIVAAINASIAAQEPEVSA